LVTPPDSWGRRRVREVEPAPWDTDPYRPALESDPAGATNGMNSADRSTLSGSLDCHIAISRLSRRPLHQLLSRRLEAIHKLFGHIPDTLEDVWVHLAQGERAEAEKLIDRATALRRRPCDAQFSVEDLGWESSFAVLDPSSMRNPCDSLGSRPPCYRCHQHRWPASALCT
jgi:hypothetical protein